MILFLFLFNFFLRWSSLAASHTFLVNFLFFDFFLLSSFLFFLLMTKVGPHSVGPTPNLTPNGQPPLHITSYAFPSREMKKRIFLSWQVATISSTRTRNCIVLKANWKSPGESSTEKALIQELRCVCVSDLLRRLMEGRYAPRNGFIKGRSS